VWVPLRSTRKLGGAVCVLLGVQIVFLGVNVIAHLHRITVIDDIAPSGSVPHDRFWTADAFAGAAELGVVLLVLGCGVVWLVWQHRAQTNARALTAGGTRFTPGWAVGWWFIPLANLVMPSLAMRELWRASIGGPDWRDQRVPVRAGVWWACWLVFEVLGFGQSGGRQTYAAIRRGDFVSVVSTIFGIGAASLAIWLVRDIVSRQETETATNVLPVPPPPNVTPPPPIL